jgi:hypothetical protein
VLWGEVGEEMTDLIKRDDVLAAIDMALNNATGDLFDCHAAIRALPAMTVERPNRETFDAMCAMRNAINEYVPMPSTESDLLQGPENSVFCATVAEAVIVEIKRLLDLQSNSKAPPADIREAALREALVALQATELFGKTASDKHVALEQYCRGRDAILALIGETK